MVQRKRVKRVASVGRAEKADVERIEHVRIVRVREDVILIPRPHPERLVVHHRPVIAAVIGPVDRILLGFDDHVDALRIGRGHRDTDAPEDSAGQAVSFQVLPVRAAVGGLVHPAADHGVRGAAHFIHRGKHDLRIVRVGFEIGGAGLVVHVKNILPGLAAVGGVEYAAFFVGTKRVAHGGDVDVVRIGGIDDDRGDVLRILEPDVGPRPACVRGFVNTVAKANVVAQTLLAGTHINDAVI